MDAISRHLMLHGAIVLLFGLLLGAPYAKAIKRGDAAYLVNSWRVAHPSLPAGGLMMLVFALALPHFAEAAWLKWLRAGSQGWGQVIYVGGG